MKKLPKKESSLGIIHIFPLLIFGFLLVGVAVLTSKEPRLESLKQSVLSESESGDNSGSSGSGSSNSTSESEDEDDEDSSGSDSDSSGKDSIKIEETEEEDEAEDEVEDGDEDENEIEVEEEFEVETGSQEAKIKAKVKLRKLANNRFQLVENEIEAQGDFPLSVDPETGILTVTTPSGVKIVTILPDQAVQNMIGGGIFQVVLKSKDNPEEELVEIEEDDGKLVYKIEGANQERLLGIFNVLVPKTVTVSAETGEAVNINQSIIARILDLFSL